jgi:hypothetical protein
MPRPHSCQLMKKSPSHEMAIPFENPQEKFVHPLRTLLAAEIGSRVHPMRTRVQRLGHGGADRPRSLNLKRVSPYHSSCTGHYRRFSNNRRKQQPAAAVHSDIGESVHTAPLEGQPCISQHPTAPLLYAQLTSAGIPACATSAPTRVQLPKHRAKTNVHQTQARLHHGCTRCVPTGLASVTAARSFLGNCASQQGIVNR